MKHLVSIIMPTYNRANRISDAIKSILNQSYENWELIIIDDCSTDKTAPVVQDYIDFDSRIQYRKLTHNIGASAARNVGLKNAKGDYITFLDSDDEYFPSKIEKQLNLFLFSNNESLGIVSCGAIDYKDGVEYNRRMPIKRNDYYESLLSKKKRIGAGTPFLMIKAKLIRDKNILFDENLLAMEDWDLVLQIVKESDFDFVEEYLVRVNHHDDERLYTSKLAAESLTKQYEKYRDELIKYPKAHRKFIMNAAVL